MQLTVKAYKIVMAVGLDAGNRAMKAAVLLFADENGRPLPGSDYDLCHECGERRHIEDLRPGEDDQRYCDWCYDSTGQDPGAWK